MKVLHSIITISLLFASGISAFATTVGVTTGTNPCPPAGYCTERDDAVQIDFNAAAGAGSPYTFGIATFSFSPIDQSPFVSGSVDGQYAAPPNDTTTYLTVGTPSKASSATIDFSVPISYYGLYLGSPDAYNSFDFYETGNNVTPIKTLTGNDLIPPGNGDQSLGRYINFVIDGGTVSRIVLSSSQAALETDNHAYVVATQRSGDEVPEPGTMGFLGTGLMGIVLWYRRWNAAS